MQCWSTGGLPIEEIGEPSSHTPRLCVKDHDPETLQSPESSRSNHVRHVDVSGTQEVIMSSTKGPTPSRSVPDHLSSSKREPTYPRPSTSSRTRTMTTARTRTMTLTGISQFDRWNTQSRATGRSSTPIRPQSMGLQQQRDIDVVVEENSEGLSALADFLMNKEPPKSNYMSVPSDDEESLSLKSSALKIFGLQENKKKRTKSKKQKLLPLPVSAVSAKTRSGARHIAISIPIQYDHPENMKTPDVTRPSTQRSQSLKIVSENGTVTVLKPVAELRESGTSASIRDVENSSKHPGTKGTPPPSEILGPETIRTLENYYQQQRKLGRGNNPPEKNKGPSTEKSVQQKSYVAVAPTPNTNIQRVDSQQTDPRHSGGSVHSDAPLSSLNSPISNSQQHAVFPKPSFIVPPTRVSSKTSAILPPMNSMFPANPHEFGKIGALDAVVNTPITTPTQTHRLEPRTPTRIKSFDSLTEPGSAGSTPPTIFSTGTAKVVRSYSASGQTKIVRSTTPTGIHPPQGPAPTRRLPRLPGDRPISAPPISGRSNSTCAMIAAANDGREGRFMSSLSAVENPDGVGNRRERVKVRKRRDMDASRPKGQTGLGVTNWNGTGQLSPPPSRESLNQTASTPQETNNPPAKNPRAKNPRRSRDLGREHLLLPGTSTSTFSSIMIVADLAPTPELPTTRRSKEYLESNHLHISQSTPPNITTNTKPRLKAPTPTKRTNATPTPPESLSEDSDTIPTSSIASFRTSGSPMCFRSAAGSKSNWALDTRRLERKKLRNAFTHERELECRLARMERDHEVLMGVVRGIAGGLGAVGEERKRVVLDE